MPATAARIGFITEEYRRAIAGPLSTVQTKYADLARDTVDPIETFFDSVDDAQILAEERLELLAEDRRRLRFDVGGVEAGLGLAYNITTPTAQMIDDERSVNAPGAIVEISIDFEKNITSLTAWG
jgi:hypothetical protein